MRRGDARTSTRQTNAIAARFRRVASSPRRAAVVRERENRGETTSEAAKPGNISAETGGRARRRRDSRARDGHATSFVVDTVRATHHLERAFACSASTRLNKEGEMRAMFAVLRGARARRRKMGKSRSRDGPDQVDTVEAVERELFIG